MKVLNILIIKKNNSSLLPCRSHDHFLLLLSLFLIAVINSLYIFPLPLSLTAPLWALATSLSTLPILVMSWKAPFAKLTAQISPVPLVPGIQSMSVG